MKRFFTDLPLSRQAALVTIAAWAFTLIAGAYVAHVSVGAAEVQRARSVVDVLDAVRDMTSRADGYYIRRDSSDDPANVGRYLTSVDLVAQGTEGMRTHTFHHKPHCLAMGDLSAELRARLAQVRFRVVSDNPFNSANAPDAFEGRSLALLRAAGGGEQWLLAEGTARYVRPLVATKACLACHGQAQEALSPIKALYSPPGDGAAGGGYGYREGQLVGLTSVTMAKPSLTATLRVRMPELLAAALAVSTLGAILWSCLKRRFIQRLRRQAHYAAQLASGVAPLEVVPPENRAGASSSKNEIDGLGASLRAMHESLASASEWMRPRK